MSNEFKKPINYRLKPANRLEKANLNLFDN